ncbi:MAG TPA: hypothetical protein VIU40_07655 [Geobacteraceae bacterium]
MSRFTFLITVLFFLLTSVPPVLAGEAGESEAGAIVTFWPLFDYRESPGEGFSNLSLLGPLVKFQSLGTERQRAVRPLFYQRADLKNETADTDYLYPLVSTNTSPSEISVQALKLYQKHVYRKDQPGAQQGTMLFPFYISGTSEKYGPYTSIFPFYGDIYERFWRDEYHYVLFPLYGRTVNKGTTSTNVLYPFFNTVSGERESGFQFWPLYGQAAKEGVYERRFALWPIYMEETTGLDGDNPVHKRYVLPLYTATDAPKLTSRTYLWPFFGYRDDRELKEEERDYLWPFWVTVRGEKRNVTRFLPFYGEETGKETAKQWYLWPLYRRDTLESPIFRRERERVLYFLYSDSRESWPKADQERRRVALWPLFVYQRDPRGVRSLSMPAPVEPVLDKEGIERSWAPFWRIYQQRWNDSDSAVSFLWNLYWHERRGDAFAGEMFPLWFYRDEEQLTEFSLFKGLIRYRAANGNRGLSFLWLPFGFHWEADTTVAEVAGDKQ